MGELRGPRMDEVVVVVALLERTGRSGWGGLGAKAFNGLKDRRGAVRLDGRAPGASPLSEGVDMSVRGRKP